MENPNLFLFILSDRPDAQSVQRHQVLFLLGGAELPL
jgi:hypothetical protein